MPAAFFNASAAPSGRLRSPRPLPHLGCCVTSAQGEVARSVDKRAAPSAAQRGVSGASVWGDHAEEHDAAR
eukprot:CAMPEP_0195102660 /NCGR_PEP_ID=MMETSP0448-20130528/68798_1 /TAXON_ID=66468 /ORGANISM="Heterocapsa triquestra, Strain CCMP 448" /LENGTH=70 /DNA_ID=CAMNT_0040138191 /DNA_START=122 /DNA_END=331 /DNA_ORIENTATION=-